MHPPADHLIRLSRDLCDAVSRLSFSSTTATKAASATLPAGARVTHVYNPLEYAREPWERYLRLAAGGPRRVVFLGMNPGPWGMAQTGVPFGEVAAVREWMGIQTEVGSPDHPHPKRPIEGFGCARSEVSGRRLWGLMKETFGSANRFFQDHFVANYCPLVFMAESGRNVTPDKLPAAEREPLFKLCDDYLVGTIEALQPRFVIGVGKFAQNRIQTALAASVHPATNAGGELTVGSILHPSPASPAANRGWAPIARQQLVELGIWPPR